MKTLPFLHVSFKKKYHIIAAGITFVSVFGLSTLPANVDAQSANASQLSNLEDQMSQLSQTIQNEEGQLSELHGQIANSQSSINQLQTIISQKEQLISEKQNQINLLNQDISADNAQITALNAQINQLYSVFVARAKASYENSYTNPFLIALGNSSIEDVFSNLEYFATTRNEDDTVLSQMKNSQYLLQQKLNDLGVQQAALTQAQTDLVNEKNGLDQQQSQLESQLAAAQTNSSIVSHQLTAAQQQYQSIVSQINSLQLGSFDGGGGCSAGLANANWWYFNQQCYGTLQGMYGTSINMVDGCLITSIAMAASYETGTLYYPAEVAAGTWFSDDYMMAWPSLPGGLSPIDLGYQDFGAINSAIASGHPAIVYLAAPDGQHWVVFYKNLGGGNYLINDPWYGSQLTFLGSSGHEYYSDYEVGDAFALE